MSVLDVWLFAMEKNGDKILIVSLLTIFLYHIFDDKYSVDNKIKCAF